MAMPETLEQATRATNLAEREQSLQLEVYQLICVHIGPTSADAAEQWKVWARAFDRYCNLDRWRAGFLVNDWRLTAQ